MMNRLGLVLGVAAVATLAGCKDPDYVGRNGRTPQNEVKDAQTEAKPAPEKPATEKPAGVTVTVTDANGKPLDNVKSDVKVEVIQIEPPAPAQAKPAEPAYTMYTVRRGDYMAKISKKYNVTISSIKRLNPQIKGDTVCIGQKIKLPGVIAIEPEPALAAEAPKASAGKSAKKGSSAPYTGATVDYVVKNGDTLGGVAYGHGINIRQLKQLNSLSSDSLKIGQKLKVPAGGKTAAKSADSAKSPTAEKKAETASVAAPAAENQVAPAEAAPTADAAAPADADAAAPKAAAPADAAQAAPAAEAKAAPVAAPATKVYEVKEGDDMAGVAVAFGITASQIRELNNLAEGDQLKPGMKIKVPADAVQQN